MPPNPPPVPRRSLSSRLLWVTIAFVLAIATVMFVPAVTVARDAWLGRRISEAQIAALSAKATPDGHVPASVVAALLRLSSTDEIRIGGAVVETGGSGSPITESIDLDAEVIPAAVFRTFAELIGPAGGRVRLTEQVEPGVILSITFTRARLAAFLGRFCELYGALSVGVALLIGALIYDALLVFLVRPISHITSSIRAFRADPERTPPLSPEETMPLDDDEMAIAARELDAMQRELRTALWRNARLAAIGTAVAKVSHDLRGILSPALLSAERLQMNDDPAVQRVGDILIRSVERATTLMQETLEFARNGTGAQPRGRCALLGAIEEAAEQVRATVPGLKIEITGHSDLEIDGDSVQMLRIFANLFRNAAAAAAGVIRVELGVDGRSIVVLVADDAGGLPASVQERLFQPFVTSDRGRSTGLGLAIVHDLVRAHGGQIALAETGPQGTMFRLTFPMSRRRQAAPSARAVSGT